MERFADVVGPDISVVSLRIVCTHEFADMRLTYPPAKTIFAGVGELFKVDDIVIPPSEMDRLMMLSLGRLPRVSAPSTTRSLRCLFK